MRKITLFFTLTICLTYSAFGQQDPMFTKYMFNSLVYNPAYAGAKDHMAIGILHRTQWWGIDGAPTTQSFTIHTPLKNERVGVGLSAVNAVVASIRLFMCDAPPMGSNPCTHVKKISVSVNS